MGSVLSSDEAISELQRAFEQRITQGVKSLLELKHLYQSTRLEYEDLLDALLKRGTTWPVEVAHRFPKLIQANWKPFDNSYRGMHHPSGDDWPPISLRPPDVKLFCQTCKRIEAFNSISSEDFLRRDQSSGPFVSSGQTIQLFVFSFLCQSCKSTPEVFLVRRQGLKLTNSGRSPIEHVDVPSVIPKSVQSFYSGAVVAHQSGQTLAGIFLLRTLIEQWARSKAPPGQLLADAVLDAYMATLPENFKSQFPSFRDLYGDLSVDIHAAKGDPALFDKARDEIVEHFEARRLFKL